MYRVLASPVSQHTSSQSQAEITGFSQNLPHACSKEFVQSQSQAKYILLSSCHHQSRPAGSQTGEVRTEISQWSLSPSHCNIHLSHCDTGPAPHTVTKHHTPPRRDGRSQVAGSQFRPDISSAASSLSPPIKTDNVTLPLMYVNETLSAASPVYQFSSSQLRTGLSLSDSRDVGVGFQ